MNKIILAYCHENADRAAAIEQPLQRIGIPFEHVNDRDGKPGEFAATLYAAEDPVLLLVTDNFFKSRDCMAGILPAVQTLNRQQRLLVALAEGRDAQGEPTPTHIDRMIHAIQYTNFWQNIYLEGSARQSQVPVVERPAFDEALEVVRDISNEIFDLITALRESDPVEWDRLIANDFAVFFQKFDLAAWHEQYKQLASPPPPAAVVEEKIAQAPVFDGFLTPAPSAPDPMTWPPEDPAVAAGDAIGETTVSEVGEPYEQPAVGHRENIDDYIGQTIRDAWFWLENGHVDRGLQVFQLALEDHPQHALLREQYDLARQRYAPHTAPASEEAPAELPQNDLGHASEAKSYDLIGEEAVAKGDYLFAKFCWDRVAELAPNYPGIFRKLGLLTSEHLREYRETAVHYLEKALETDPDDLDVRERLAALLRPAPPAADIPEEPLAPAEPDLAPNDPGPADKAIPAADLAADEPERASAAEAAAPRAVPPAVPRERLTVMITGATSGIGRATAELFARHGHRLLLTGRRADRLDALKQELESAYAAAVHTLNFDVRDYAAVRDHLEHLPEEWRDVDVLLNNAGLAKGLSPIHEGELDHWETMIDTNLKGLLYVTRCIAPHMVRRRRGHIINLGSSAGKEVYAQGNVYCATKFAVDALTRAMRLDLHTHGIRVSQVSPGHVEETEFALNRFDGDAEKAQIYNDFQPLKAADVAETIYFIATRPLHVNIQDVWMFGTQQASATVIDRSGRKQEHPGE